MDRIKPIVVLLFRWEKSVSVGNISTREVHKSIWMDWKSSLQKEVLWLCHRYTASVSLDILWSHSTSHKINVDKMTNDCVSMMTWHINENLVGIGYPKLSFEVCFHIKIEHIKISYPFPYKNLQILIILWYMGVMGLSITTNSCY